MKEWFAAKTKGFRHGLGKLLVPSIGTMLETNFRPMIQFLKQQFGDKPLVGVEIGVGSGMNALNMLKNLNMKRLYLIDPYTRYVQDGKLSGNPSDSLSMAEKRLRKFRNYVTWIKQESSVAVDVVPSGVDFVYVDGNHGYAHVKEDITLYYPKVKAGGVLGGHDFNGLYVGVVKAVLEFAGVHGLECSGLMDEWWIVKKCQ